MRIFSIVAGLAVAMVPAAALAEPPAYTVGGGIRAGFNDDTAAVLQGKVRVAEFGDALDLSVRPAMLIGNELELRLPIVVDWDLADGLYPYAGAGLAYNADGLSDVDPMLSGGIDIEISPRFYLGAAANLVFQNSDTDVEVLGTLNYAF